MADQLLGWLVMLAVVLPAVTICLNHLRAALDALNWVIVSATGVVISARAFWAALRPAKPVRQVKRQGKRPGSRRPRSNRT